jgi:hypothetical protein
MAHLRSVDEGIPSLFDCVDYAHLYVGHNEDLVLPWYYCMYLLHWPSSWQSFTKQSQQELQKSAYCRYSDDAIISRGIHSQTDINLLLLSRVQRKQYVVCTYVRTFVRTKLAPVHNAEASSSDRCTVGAVISDPLSIFQR